MFALFSTALTDHCHGDLNRMGFCFTNDQDDRAHGRERWTLRADFDAAGVDFATLVFMALNTRCEVTFGE